VTNKFALLARKGVQELTPYQPGKPVEELERELGITGSLKLASNENPLGCSDKVREYLASGNYEPAIYPDANGFYLKEKIAERLGVTIPQVTLGNGSNDVLDILARVFAGPGDEVVYSQYGFLVYPIVTKAVGAIGIEVPAKQYGHDLVAMADAISARTKLVFIANPNNPTGTWITQSELQVFLDRVPPSVIVVVDEAYVEYVDVPDYPDALALSARYPNLVITRTFSKAYGLAGLRIGFSVSHPDIADLMNRVRQPFNNSCLALKAAEIALNDQEFIERSVETNKAGYLQITQCLDRLGVDYVPSQGNFVLIRVGSQSDELYQQWLEQGVIVRPVANYGLVGFLRVSIATEEQNQRLIDLLEAWRAD
jgi:histidinol-phosphate aminotransferase